MKACARSLGTALTVTAFVLAPAPPALACACCTNTGWRHVEVEKFGPQRRAQIDQIRFAKTAELYTGEANAAIKGVADAVTGYQLAVSREKDRMVFSFRDAKDRAGVLMLALPNTISIFEVDPRGPETDSGLGPSLYKEWKLTAKAAGDGLFRGVVGHGRTITLVLHGRGIGCADYGHFSAWSLLVHGLGDRLMLYGALDAAGK